MTFPLLITQYKPYNLTKPLNKNQGIFFYGGGGGRLSKDATAIKETQFTDSVKINHTVKVHAISSFPC